MKLRFLRSDKGTSLIEFAIVLPVLMFLLVGLIEFGRFGYDSILAANAARAGVQYGAQDTSTAIDSQGIINAATADGQHLSSWTVTPNHLCSVSGGTPQACSVATGSGPPTNTTYYVQVQVTGTFHPMLNYPGIPANVPVSGSAIMRVVSQ
ncbi:MAG: TadE/TadG family type IV pilus assembly protein [Candidatus Cybelea sp.]